MIEVVGLDVVFLQARVIFGDGVSHVHLVDDGPLLPKQQLFTQFGRRGPSLTPPIS